MTDPSVAKNFIEDTGVDTLAIAIGTAHGVYIEENQNLILKGWL